MALNLPSTLAPIGAVAIDATALGRAVPVLADDVDPVTGDFRSLTAGADPIDAAVQLALVTVRGSGAAVLEDGLEVTSRKFTESIDAELESDVRLALRRLVQTGDIEIVSVEITLKSEGAQTEELYVKYKNLKADGGSTLRSALVPLPRFVSSP